MMGTKLAIYSMHEFHTWGLFWGTLNADRIHTLNKMLQKTTELTEWAEGKFTLIGLCKMFSRWIFHIFTAEIQSQ